MNLSQGSRARRSRDHHKENDMPEADLSTEEAARLQREADIDELENENDRRALVAMLADEPFEEETPTKWTKRDIAERIVQLRQRASAEAEAGNQDDSTTEPEPDPEADLLLQAAGFVVEAGDVDRGALALELESEDDQVDDVIAQLERLGIIGAEDQDGDRAILISDFDTISQLIAARKEPGRAGGAVRDGIRGRDYESESAAGVEEIEAIAENLSLDEVRYLTGDLRDAVIEQFKHRPRPWSQLSSAEQKDLVSAVEFGIGVMARKAVKLVASRGAQAVQGKLKSYKDAGEKIVVTLEVVAASSEDIVALHSAVNKDVVVTSADAGDFSGQRRPAENLPDQPDLEFADPEDPLHDDSDLAGETEIDDMGEEDDSGRDERERGAEEEE